MNFRMVRGLFKGETEAKLVELKEKFDRRHCGHNARLYPSRFPYRA